MGKYFQILFLCSPHPWPMRAQYAWFLGARAGSTAQGGCCAPLVWRLLLSHHQRAASLNENTQARTLLQHWRLSVNNIILFLWQPCIGKKPILGFFYLIYSPIIRYFNYHSVGPKMYYSWTAIIEVHGRRAPLEGHGYQRFDGYYLGELQSPIEGHGYERFDGYYYISMEGILFLRYRLQTF